MDRYELVEIRRTVVDAAHPFEAMEKIRRGEGLFVEDETDMHRIATQEG